jgi:hypothetical protein
MIKKFIIVLVLVVLLYRSFGFFIIEPIGAIPDGVTILYWRWGVDLPFISSVDGLLGDRVSILGRAITFVGVIKRLEDGNRIIMKITYKNSGVTPLTGITFSPTL